MIPNEHYTKFQGMNTKKFWKSKPEFCTIESSIYWLIPLNWRFLTTIGTLIKDRVVWNAIQKEKHQPLHISRRLFIWDYLGDCLYERVGTSQ